MPQKLCAAHSQRVLQSKCYCWSPATRAAEWSEAFEIPLRSSSSPNRERAMSTQAWRFGSKRKIPQMRKFAKSDCETQLLEPGWETK